MVGRHIMTADAHYVHIATEGPLGYAARTWCIKNKRRFTTGFHTRFPEYIAARLPVPIGWSYAVLRWFHSASAGVMVATNTLAKDLTSRGFARTMIWPRGVDLTIFKPTAERLPLPRPCFVYCGRVAVEKNIEAFLKLELTGCKLVVGDGPARAELQKRFPNVHFVGMKSQQDLALYYSNADVFVFPSKTDTFGNVILEALACGAPVAAYPVPGPSDIIGTSAAGVLDNDLGLACLRAQHLSRHNAQALAAKYTWRESALLFLKNIQEANAL